MVAPLVLQQGHKLLLPLLLPTYQHSPTKQMYIRKIKVQNVFQGCKTIHHMTENFHTERYFALCIIYILFCTMYKLWSLSTFERNRKFLSKILHHNRKHLTLKIIKESFPILWCVQGCKIEVCHGKTIGTGVLVL